MMDRDELLSLYTTEDVISLMTELGSNYPQRDHQGNYIFTTVCHGGDSAKLWYYPESKCCMCFSCCGSLSLFDVVSGALNMDFGESFKYLAKRKGVAPGKRKLGLQTLKIENEDLEFLSIHLYKPKKQSIELPAFSETILNVFMPVYPLDWYKEGIGEEAAKLFEIGYYPSQNRATIPHRDINGNLVGIRARSYNDYEVNNGRKYMPITVQGLTYRYPMSHNLYGIYQNQDNIRRHKRAIIFESEKSCLLYETMYGRDKNITVALCSMNMSLYQRDLLLNLGVNEVIFCLDKQYTLECLETKKGKEYLGFVSYVKKLKRLSAMFMNYCQVSVVLCWDDRIGYKDAPIDRGIATFEELLNEKYLISDTSQFDELIDE